jgi:DNA-binding MarR family transcriptional regulator
MVEETLSQTLIRVLRHIGRVQLYGRMVEGCTVGESILLFVISRHLRLHQRGPKVSELGSLLRVKTPSVTQMINGLEARGLVERGPDPEDRRVVRVRLTEEGLRIMRGAEESLRKEMEGLIARLGEERARMLVELLGEAIQYFEEKHEACRSHEGHAALGEGSRT